MRETVAAYHAQTHSFIAVYQVAQILAGSSNGNPLLVPQLMESALNPKIRLPILAIGYTTQPNVESTIETPKVVNEKDSPAPPAIVPSR